MMNQESRKAGKELRNREITERVIAAAIRVHRDLGPGFLESVYEEALAVEFALSGIQFVRQHPVPLFYKDHQIGEHRLDFLIENRIFGGAQSNPIAAGYSFRNRTQLPKGDATGGWITAQLRDLSANHKAILPGAACGSLEG